MSVDIPNPMGVKLSGSVGSIGPVTIAGFPDTFHVAVQSLPKIQIGLDKVQLGVDKVQLGIDKLHVALDKVELAPLTLSVGITELPSMRVHLPASFRLALNVLGLDVMQFRVCGEAQVVTEPYVPNPRERCAQQREPKLPVNPDGRSK